MVNRVINCALFVAIAATQGCGNEVRQAEEGDGDSTLLDAVYGEGYVAPEDVPERVKCEDFCTWSLARHGCYEEVCLPLCDPAFLDDIADYGCDIELFERYYACLIREDATCGEGCRGEFSLGEQIGLCLNYRASDTCETLPGFQDFGEPCPPE